jgi:RNA polymerase sigma factor (TIGR02999 family)
MDSRRDFMHVLAELPAETAHAPASADASAVTALLIRWREGDPQALAGIFPVVYDRLRDLAHQRLRGEGRECSLDTTGLVHEVYLRLARGPGPSLQNRSHFLALASRVMRHLLIDHARERKAAKRGGGVRSPEAEPLLWVPQAELDAFTELDAALRRLEAMDRRQGLIVEQRYFGGLSLAETAEALGVSVATVKRELRSARAWLARELRNSPMAG